MKKYRLGAHGLASIVALVVLSALSSRECWADLWGLSFMPPNGMAEPGTEDNYNKVFRFDNDGNKLPNDVASGSGGLNSPSGIAVSPIDGTLYVSSAGTGSILRFDGQTGGFLGLFAFLETAAPAQLAFGPDGNLFVSEYFGTNVRVYDAHPGPTFGDRLTDAATGLTTAGGLAFAANGDLLVGDGFVMAPGQSARIVRVHNGIQSTFGISDQGMLSSPSALEFLPNGDLLVVDLLGNYIARFDSTGFGFSPFATIPPAIPDPLPPGAFVPSNNPSDIDFDPDGNIVVSVMGLTNPPDDRGALLRFDLSGDLLETIADGLEPISGIAWTPNPDTLRGNYDGDQTIGPSDFAMWSADFGKFVARGNGADGNGDGIVDAADYVVWRKTLVTGEGASPAIPEPTTLAILLIGSLFGAARGRRVFRATAR